MTVEELIAELQKMPPRLPVFMKSDPDGNQTHAVGGLGRFVGFHGPYGIQEMDVDELDVEGPDDPAFVSAVTIWPGYGESFDE